MIPPKGHNLKYFYNDESQIVRRATASVSNYHEKLSFNVPADKKDVVKASLGNLLANEWNTDTYGTWLTVLGINNIKKALYNLQKDLMIPEGFYNNITNNFPIPGGGTINILEKRYPVHHTSQRLFIRPIRSRLDTSDDLMSRSIIYKCNFRG